MSAWHEDDAFWLDAQSFIFSEERRRQAPAEVADVIKLLSLPAGADVLDLGCGVGRHALEFARRGFRVTGVDRLSPWLDIARDSARQERLSVEWVHADMLEFQRPAAFDAAVSLLTSFGYFADPLDDLRVARNVLTSLKPGGAFVIDLMGREVLARIFRQRDWQQAPDGSILLEDRRVCDDFAWLEATWTILRADRRTEHRIGMRLYSAADLKNLLTSAGFASAAAYGALAGGPYDLNASRLVIVGKKGRPVLRR
ncbi:MAG: Ubiquinone biosynthesis O-methyltransferase [Phycisphaerae bacterium]|nr:Ubiquinone biosynthesis O-methyltransferase [Phycisphaerae bacterium]